MTMPKIEQTATAKPTTGKKAPVAKKGGGRSVKADEPTREPVWNDRRTNIVKAMRALGAVDKKTAVTAGKIGEKANTFPKADPADWVDLVERVDLAKIVLDVYRTSELVHNGFVASVREDGERELRYYLTTKGQKTAFPQPVKKDKPVAAGKKETAVDKKKAAAKKKKAAAAAAKKEAAAAAAEPALAGATA
jgi:hypothetical protein